MKTKVFKSVILIVVILLILSAVVSCDQNGDTKENLIVNGVGGYSENTIPR